MPDNKMQVIPLGYESDIFCYQDLSPPTPNFRIGFAGKVTPAKRIETLIEAVALLGPTYQIEIAVAGLADCETQLRNSLSTRAKTLGVKLIELPLLNARDLATFYNSIDMAVFPGSISITTLEASGCGTPICLYRSIDGIETRVANNRGYLYKSNDELVNIIAAAAISREPSHVRRSRASQTAGELSWKKIAGEYSSLYARLLCG
jgi:glycosyltransferase involved in cell wall biosynthesis